MKNKSSLLNTVIHFRKLKFVTDHYRMKRSRKMKPSARTEDTFLGFFSSVRSRSLVPVGETESSHFLSKAQQRKFSSQLFCLFQYFDTESGDRRSVALLMVLEQTEESTNEPESCCFMNQVSKTVMTLAFETRF